MRVLTLLSLLMMTGCTAGRATYYLIDADRAYQDAVEASAEEKAVYEFTMAWMYRDKAWEEWGYSDYEASEKLALLAAEYARQAEKVAIHGAEERQLIDELEVVPDQLAPQVVPEDLPDPVPGEVPDYLDDPMDDEEGF